MKDKTIYEIVDIGEKDSFYKERNVLIGRTGTIVGKEVRILGYYSGNFYFDRPHKSSFYQEGIMSLFFSEVALRPTVDNQYKISDEFFTL